MEESIETRITDFYSFCQPAEVLHDTIPTPPSKSSRVESGGGLRPPGTCICVGRSGGDVAGVSDSGGRSSVASYR